jgi:hypothetical protein
MSEDRKVGYRNPPKHTRFRPGQSGNPKGRPKDAKNLKTELEEELAEKVQVREGNKTLIVSKRRALIKRLMADALGGKASAQRTLIDMADRLLEHDAALNDSQELSPEEQEILKAVLDRRMGPGTDAAVPDNGNGDRE